MPEGSAEGSLQQAEPEPEADHYEAQPDWGQAGPEQEPLPRDWKGLQQAPPLDHDDSAAPVSQALPCLLLSQPAGVLHALTAEEVETVLPGKAQLTSIEATLLPALIRLSSGVIDALLHRLHEALGPGLLRRL